MQIIDAQGHLNMVGPIDRCLAAMDAVGIAGVFYDEADGHDARGREIPGIAVGEDVWRPMCPQALAAARAHPDRIGLMRRIHYRDPDVVSIVDELAAGPFRSMVRLTVTNETQVTDALAGALDSLCSATAARGLPLVLLAPGRMDVVANQASRFPDLSIVIDHCGFPMPRSVAPSNHATVQSSEGYRAPPRPTGSDLAGRNEFAPVLALARFPNVFLKWSHAPFFASAEGYPFADTIPLLRDAITAFGVERIMWAGDFTVVRPHYSWAEALFYLRDTPDLTAHEKASLLGGTVRRLTSWPPS